MSGLRSWLLAMALALLAPQVFAHALQVVVQAADDAVIGEALYADLSPAVGGAVSVFDAAGAPLGRGTTDDDGAFRIEVPMQAGLRVVVEDDEGHHAEVVLQAVVGSDLAQQRDSIAAEHAHVTRQETTGRIVFGVLVFVALVWGALWLRRRRKGA